MKVVKPEGYDINFNTEDAELILICVQKLEELLAQMEIFECTELIDNEGRYIDKYDLIRTVNQLACLKNMMNDNSCVKLY